MLSQKKEPVRHLRTLEDANANPMALDRLIHERIRLGIVSALAVNEKLSFGDLKTILSTSDGNLSVHARKLEEAKYIVCTKTFVGRVPKTEYTLTDEGKDALTHYLGHMEALIQMTQTESPKSAEKTQYE